MERRPKVDRELTGELVEEVLRTALALEDVLAGLLEELPAGAFQGRDNAQVLMGMVVGSVHPAAAVAGVRECRSAIASGMPTHFDDAESGEPIAIETHVHLLSEHVATGRAAELDLAELHERVVDDEWVELKPKWERFRDNPISFAFVWVGRA